MDDIESFNVAQMGMHVAESFPKRIAINVELCQMQFRGTMVVKGDEVSFNFANGSARYLKIGQRGTSTVFERLRFKMLRRPLPGEP